MVQTLKEQAREELQVIQQGLIPEVLIIQQEVLQTILQLEQPGHLPLEVLQREVQVDLKQQPELQGPIRIYVAMPTLVYHPCSRKHSMEQDLVNKRSEESPPTGPAG